MSFIEKVKGKQVKVLRGPATVSAELAAIMPLVIPGRLQYNDETQARRPAYLV